MDAGVECGAHAASRAATPNAALDSTNRRDVCDVSTVGRVSRVTAGDGRITNRHSMSRSG
jgi:hypothetical protein